MDVQTHLVCRAGDITVWDVRCAAGPGDHAVEVAGAFEVVLPLAGTFRRDAMSTHAVVDASCAYVATPDTEQQIAHRGGGDRCVAIEVSGELAADLGLDEAPPATWLRRRPVDTDTRMVAAWQARAADPLVVEERWLAVVARTVQPAAIAGAATRDAGLQRRRVDAVREALAADPGRAWDLRALGRVAGYAPHHLSRLFSRHTGLTVGTFRTRIRLAAAMGLLADGMGVAEVAATLGFSDHSHLTRRFRQAHGTVPSRLLPRTI